MIGQTWLCVGSLFGQAAAVWEQGETQEAVKMSAQALTMGIQYKYTGIFTEYGQTGVRLIEAYRKMTGLDDNLSMAGRKKKYYGNVMTASYEGYHSIFAEKSQKRNALWTKSGGKRSGKNSSHNDGGTDTSVYCKWIL